MASRPPKSTLKSRGSGNPGSNNHKLGITVNYDDVRKQLSSTQMNQDVNNNQQNTNPNFEHIHMNRAVYNNAFTGRTDSQATAEEKKALLNYKQSGYQQQQQQQYLQPKQKQQQMSYMTDSTVNVGDFIGSDGFYLHDDLSQLPQLDEKILTTTLKNRFESRKYYVSNTYYGTKNLVY